MTDAGAGALVTGERVFLRELAADDGPEFARRVRESISLHHPWMEMPATLADFDRYFSRSSSHLGNIRLNICEVGSGVLVGGININNIVYGRFKSAAIGYWAYAGTAGRGYMSEGLRLVIRYAFGELGLHRLEANIQPTNEDSIKLVKRNGFRYEGTSPDYLFINGAGRDHERWAITAEMVDPPVGS